MFEEKITSFDAISFEDSQVKVVMRLYDITWGTSNQVPYDEEMQKYFSIFAFQLNMDSNNQMSYSNIMPGEACHPENFKINGNKIDDINNTTDICFESGGNTTISYANVRQQQSQLQIMIQNCEGLTCEQDPKKIQEYVSKIALSVRIYESKFNNKQYLS